jgi:Lon protease-like protein
MALEVTSAMLAPDSAGVMILSSAVLFPQAMLPLFIFEPRYRTMLEEALDSHRMFCVAMQKPNDPRETPLPVAGVGIVRAAVKNANGTSNLVLQGIARVRLGRVIRYKPYRLQQLHVLDIGDVDTVTIHALRVRVLELVEARLRQADEVASDLLDRLVKSGGDPENPIRSAMGALERVPDAGHMADLVSLLMIGHPLARQVILQSADVTERLRHLIHFLQSDVAGQPTEGPAPT